MISVGQQKIIRKIEDVVQYLKKRLIVAVASSGVVTRFKVKGFLGKTDASRCPFGEISFNKRGSVGTDKN